MDKAILAQLRESIAAGLKRRTLTTCSRWAEACVIMGKPFPGPFKWDHHPWLKEMHDSNALWNVGQKSAQMGFTVAAMNRTFYKIDVERQNCLYLLPTKTPDATDFSATRFDPLLELSPHLDKLFSDVKNVATKRAGSATLYIRGANSRSGLKSIPVSFIVFDEFDEMNQDNIPLALERLSGQLQKQIWAISTPTVPGHGINSLFLGSTMEHFFFKCLSCQRLTELIWPDSIVICGDSVTDPDIKKSHIICKECKAVIRQEAKPEWFRSGIWVPTGHEDMENRGFYINQMYSATISAEELAVAVMKAETDPSAEQELHNSKFGNPHVVDGARVTDVELDKAQAKGYRRKSDPEPESKLITMGVDVGKWLHCEIAHWEVKRFGNDINIMSDCHVLWEGKCQNFEDLDQLMRQWRIVQCVIDANPERRKAYEFACRFWGHVKLCYYARGMSGKMVNIDSDTKEHKVNVDRTSWMDISLGRFHSGTIILPTDVSNEYKTQIKSPIRIYEKDAEGNPVGKYISTSDDSGNVIGMRSDAASKSSKAPDHFAHARNYNEIALPLAACLVTNSDIKKFL